MDRRCQTRPSVTAEILIGKFSFVVTDRTLCESVPWSWTWMDSPVWWEWPGGSEESWGSSHRYACMAQETCAH